MRLQVKGKNLEVPPAIREYAESKLAKLDRQVKRAREKRRSRFTRLRAAPPAETLPETTDEHPQIVRTKQFALKPMTPEEAVLQLDLIGHDFFVFRNGDTDEINVVYRRRDGNYGL